jgi:hypothetical protein
MDPDVRFTSTPSEPVYPSLLKPSGQPNTLDYSTYGYYPEPPGQAVLVSSSPQPAATAATKIDITAKLFNEAAPRRHDHVYESASLPGFARFAMGSPCPAMTVPCSALGTIHRRCPEYYELETDEKGRQRHLTGHECGRGFADSPQK